MPRWHPTSSNLPAIFTDAFSTSNLIQLFTGVTSKTGAWARLTDGSAAHAKRQRAAIRMAHSLSVPCTAVNRSGLEPAPD